MPSTPRPLRYPKIDMEAIFNALKELDHAAKYRTAERLLERLLRLIPEGTGPANLNPATLYDLRRIRDFVADSRNARKWTPGDRDWLREWHVNMRLAWGKELRLKILCPDLMNGVTLHNYGERLEECRTQRDNAIDPSRLDRPAPFPMANLICNNQCLYSGEMGDPAPLQTLEELREWLIDKHDSIETILGYGIATTAKALEEQLETGRECLRHAVLWYRHFTTDELSLRIPSMTTSALVFDGFAHAIERVKSAIVEVAPLPPSNLRSPALAGTTEVPKRRGRKPAILNVRDADGKTPTPAQWLERWEKWRADAVPGTRPTMRSFLAEAGVKLPDISDVKTAIESAQRFRRRTP